MDQGDLVQASEKGWGAAAQMVKAIAEQRGWRHRAHEFLFDAVDALAEEAGDEDIDRLFDVASALHVNFYENWASARRVHRGLRDVGLLLDKLEPLPTSQPSPHHNAHDKNPDSPPLSVADPRRNPREFETRNPSSFYAGKD